MKNITLLLLLTFSISATAQYSEIKITSENKAPFYLSINGIPQNNHPLNYINLKGLENTNYNLFIDYRSPEIPDIQTNIYLNNNQNTVGVYSYSIPMYYQNGLSLISFTPFNNNYQSTTQTIITQTTTNSQPNNDNMSINMNLGIGGQNMNDHMNINMNIGSNQQQTQTTQTTQTTIINNSNHPQYTANNNVSYSNNCMRSNDFNNAKTTISSKSFEESKLTIAKQICNANKLSAKQIKRIMELFTFENTRLEFAKVAYSSCCDQKNYYQVNDAFEYELSIDELEEFIN
tara:strand:- start:174 stop:1040 length:867 start_codon:yes stop_codon:yes gene_type:complete